MSLECADIGPSGATEYVAMAMVVDTEVLSLCLPEGREATITGASPSKAARHLGVPALAAADRSTLVGT